MENFNLGLKKFDLKKISNYNRYIFGTWELRSSICGFIVIGVNQIANFEMKTTSLISKFDSKFANLASKLEKQLQG